MKRERVCEREKGKRCSQDPGTAQHSTLDLEIGNQPLPEKKSPYMNAMEASFYQTALLSNIRLFSLLLQHLNGLHPSFDSDSPPNLPPRNPHPGPHPQDQSP